MWEHAQELVDEAVAVPVDDVVGAGEVITVDPMPSTSLTAHPKADAADAASEWPRGSDSSARSTVPPAIRVSTRFGDASGSKSISIPMTPSKSPAEDDLRQLSPNLPRCCSPTSMP